MVSGRSRFLGLDVRRHPWLAGQVWGALACLSFALLQALKGRWLPFEGLAVLIGLCMLGGVAFGAAMSIFAAASRPPQ